MTLNEMTCRRKSCRQFAGKPVDAEMIKKIRSKENLPALSGYTGIDSGTI